MTRTRLLAVGVPAALLIVAAVAFGAVQWRATVVAGADAIRMADAQGVLKNQPYDALEFYYQSRAAGFPGDSQAQWAKIHAEALFRINKIPELADAYGRRPKVLAELEEASRAVSSICARPPHLILTIRHFDLHGHTISKINFSTAKHCSNIEFWQRRRLMIRNHTSGWRSS
jgi:hypothetical protein